MTMIAKLVGLSSLVVGGSCSNDSTDPLWHNCDALAGPNLEN